MQVEFETGGGRGGGVQFFVTDDGTFDVEEAGGGAGEGEGGVGCRGAEFVEDG